MPVIPMIGLSRTIGKNKAMGGEGADKRRTASVETLWVCWKRPTTVLASDALLLSFLPPLVEDEMEARLGMRIIRAREVSLEIRADARAFYIDLVARIGTVGDGSGRTLRQTLACHDQASSWWYHMVSFRACEIDPIFQWIIAVRTIQTVADRYGVRKLILVGAPEEVAEALTSRFTVTVRGGVRRSLGALIWLRGVASRIRYIAQTLRNWIAIRRWTRCPGGLFEIVLSGFWDWSVWKDQHTRSLTDRYFGSLPEQLRLQGIRSLGWFVWFDPHAEPNKKNRRLKTVLAPLAGCNEVVVLQWFLRPLEVLKAARDFGPLQAFLNLRKRQTFKALFFDKGINYYPLFEHRLLLGFLNSGLPHYALFALATERACRKYRPKVTMSFLEHFPYSRAHYEGVRRAGCGTVRWAVQHCSYSHEKTFLFLHPSLEFRGEPDGCPIPHPDAVYAMGTFGQELFWECGYEKDQILLTGSPRYDHVRLSMEPSSKGTADRHGLIRLLMVSTLDVRLEVDMVEAVCAATQGMEGVKLLLRNHPFSRIEEHPRFATWRDRIELTRGTLQDDISLADLILFTYSTVAEEALLQGKAVWQWLPLGFNGSALSEAVTITRFGSVVGLRQAIGEFMATPNKFLPSRDIQSLALTRLFYPGDGRAAARIARECVIFLGNNKEQSANRLRQSPTEG